jgi:molybdate transport system permease protein
MPSEIYYELQADPDTAIALSVLMIVVSVVILSLLRERWISGIAP